MKLSNSQSKALSVGALTLVLFSGKSYASQITLDAVNSGFYNLFGMTSQSLGFSGNILLLGPWTSGGAPLYHNWLAFDLTSVNSPILNATLKVYSDPRNASGQTILWRDVTTPYAQLGLPGSTPGDNALGKQIFNELGSGNVFGQGPHVAGTLNTYSLTQGAVDSLNAADGIWSIAGENLDPIPNPDNLNTAYGYLWGAFAYPWSSSKPTIQLTLDVADIPANNVPDSGSTLAMLGIGFLGSIALRKRVAA